MNFFQHQQQARRSARRMLVLFALAVVVVIVAVDAAVAGLLLLTDSPAGWLQPRILVTVGAITAAVIACGSLYKIATLRSGGSAVARQLGGTPVPAQTTNFAWKRLRNVVEEIAIASGVPVPEIFVLERESGINAFAAGYTPSDAAVTVTQGALDKLTRDELQGVIAHEFSHVLNGDMRLNIRLMGVVFGILVLGVAGRKILEHGGRGKNAGAVIGFAVSLLVIGYVGMLCGRMIKAAIARQREFLADASAVQFTRQPIGIGGALKKIGALAEGSRLVRAEAEEVAHMLFCDGIGYAALTATHPPLLERIRRIEPRFDPRELEDIARAWTKPIHSTDIDDPGASIAGFVAAIPLARAASTPSSAALPAASTEVTLSAAQVVGQVGNPGRDDYAAADAIGAAIPDALRRVSQDPQRAPNLVLALALARDDAQRARQLDLIARAYDDPTRVDVGELATALATLHPMQRLPLASLAFPRLRRKPRPQLQQFVVVLNDLIHLDGIVGLDEYCLTRLVSLQVVEALDPSRARVNGSRRLTQCADEIGVVFALLARHGHDDAAAAERAFRLGVHEVLPDARIDLVVPADWPVALDRALAALDQLKPAGKELLVRGLTRAIGEDGHMSVAEAELLRTVCAAVHCPLPPLA